MPLPEWIVSPQPVNYPQAVAAMEERVRAIAAGEAPELVWLLEHPPLYTAGTGARDADLLDAGRFPVYRTGRGGQFTYHGPGQRIAYVMLDLKRRAAPGQPDLRAYVKRLEGWIIATLARLGVEGFTREGRIGVWVKMSGFGIQDSGEKNPSLNPESRILTPEKKIAALGIRVRKWVSYHGIALNVNPDLSHYAGIVPCGIRDYGVTSLAALGVDAPMAEVDALLKEEFARALG